MAEIQSLRFAIEENNLDKLDSASSVHELTGVVKLFFRELNEPLIPWKVILLIYEAVQGEDVKEKVKELLSTSFMNKYNSWWPSGSIKKKDFPENMNLMINVMRFIFSNIQSLDLLMLEL